MFPRQIQIQIASLSLSLLLLGKALGIAAPAPTGASPENPKSPDATPVITLEQAYDMALHSEQQIQIAYWEVRKANLLPWSALAKTIGLQIQGGADLGHDETTSRADSDKGRTLHGIRTDNGNLNFSATQPLIDATVFPSYKIGKLSAQSARLAHQYTVRGVLFAVAKAYYEVLNQQRIVEVNRQAVELNQKQLEYASRRAAVGEVTRSDVLRAQVAVEGAHKTLIESENLLLSDRNLLANSIGVSNDHFEVVEPKDYPPNSEPFEKLLATAYERREDLKVAELEIQKDQQRHKLVAAGYYPSLSAGFKGGLSQSRSIYDASKDSWTATLSVDVPIWNGGQRELDMISTREQIIQTRLKMEQLARQIQEDAKTAWLLVRSLQETLKALSLQVQAAEQSYKDLDNQYRAGTATSLDVLTALNELNSSRRDLTVQTYAFQVALRNLEQVAGTFQQQRVEQVKIR